jgi:hypothetical protein
MLSLGACTRSPPSIPAPSSIPDASAIGQICRAYAQEQKAISADLMYDQCLYARGHTVPGFSPSPDSPGYEGELPGPALHDGGA